MGEAAQQITQKRPSRAWLLVEEVCAYYGLSPDVLLLYRCPNPRCRRNAYCRCGNSPRHPSYCEARFLICYLLHEDMSVSRARMGLLLHRDRSTIGHNLRRARALLASRGDLRWHLAQLRQGLRDKGVLR
jgi:hypothetical protein